LRSLVKEAFARIENQVRSAARNKRIPLDGANGFAIVRSPTAIAGSVSSADLLDRPEGPERAFQDSHAAWLTTWKTLEYALLG
jgi:hypothetical protein